MSSKTWRETREQIPGEQPFPYSAHDTRPNFYIITNNGAASIYISSNSNVSPSTFDITVPPYGVRVYAKPDYIPQVWFYASQDTNVHIGSMEREFDPSMISQTQEIAQNTASGVLATMDVREILNALPAGTNKIGLVDIENLPKIDVKSLPGVDINSIPAIDVNQLPSLPAGTNKIGLVDIENLPKIDVKSLPGVDINSIPAIDVNQLPSLPAGTNNIGKIDVNQLPAQPEYFTPVTKRIENNVAFEEVIATGGRPHVMMLFFSSTVETYILSISLDGTNWWQYENIDVSVNTHEINRVLPFPYIKVEGLNDVDHLVQIAATR